MDVFACENEELIKQVQLLRLCRKVQLWQSHSAASTAWSAAEIQLSGNIVPSEVVAELQMKCSSSSEVLLRRSCGCFRIRKRRINKNRCSFCDFVAKCSYGKAIVQRIKECAVLPTAKCSYGKAIVQLQLR